MRRFLIGLCIVAVTCTGLHYLCRDASAPVARRQAEDKPLSPEARAALEKIAPHQKAAEKAALAAVTKACDRADDFFRQRRERAHAFAEEALSLRSKWEYLKGAAGAGDGHRHFLHTLFEEKVFSQKELADLLTSVVEEYLQALRGIENDLLVAIRADLDDSALPELRAAAWTKTDQLFQAEYTEALKQVTGTVSRDMAVLIGREAVAWVAADVAGSIATSLAVSVAQRIGLSATVMGSGVAAGAATLGLSLVAGCIIDALLDWVIQAMGYDPVEEVRDQIDLLFQEFQGVLIFGDAYEPPIYLSPFPDARSERRLEKMFERWKRLERNRKDRAVECKGFFRELAAVYEARAKLRDAALRDLIVKGGK
jgi:hypothetical protein